MQDLRARGPLVADFEPPLSFSMYHSGVFSEEHSKVLKNLAAEEKEKIKSKDSINYRTLMDYNVQWQRIDHSILIVGWGVEDGIKYWDCQNSYGPDFGNNGFFKIRRGADDYGIESQPSAFIPKLL